MSPTDHQGRTGSQQGFTLMEVLVAMMILAVSLTAVFELFSGSLRSAHLSKQYLQGVYLAREKLEEALLDEQLTVGGARAGELAGGYRWQIEVEPLVSPDEQLPPTAPRLIRVVAEVGWREGAGEKSFRLETLHLAFGPGRE